MVKTRGRVRLSVLVFSIAMLVALVAPGAVQAQTGIDGVQNTLTVLTVDSGDTGTTFIARWLDSVECNSQYAIYIGGVDTDKTSLPDGAMVSGTGLILAGTAESTDALLSVKFPIFEASGLVNTLSVSLFCGDHSTGRPVAEVNDIPVDTDSGRPVEGAYSGELTLGLRFSGTPGSLDTFDANDSGLSVARIDRQAQGSAGEGVFYHALAPVSLSSDSETHSSISTTIADSGTTGSTFTITWVDAGTCAGNYNLYMDNIDSDGVGLPSGATQDSDGRVHLGAVAATTDPLQTVATFSAVKAVSDSDHLALQLYCGDTGRKIESDEFPVVSTTLRPVAGTYSSAPGITAFQIDGTAQSDFDPYKTHEEYDYTWNAGGYDVATIKPVLKDGYSATFHGSTKTVYVITANGVEIGKFATWTIDYDLPISDADDTEDDFQFRFDDNDPNGTDMFLLSVSRGDYHTGHHYIFFVIRKATVTGPFISLYAEDETDAIGTYSIPAPDRDYDWRLASRTGEGEEDDKDAFTITKNDDGNGVLSFASSPDYEVPTDSSSPPDNIYHTSVLGWEVSPVLGLWYGNYYGSLDVQVIVTDVDPE